MNDNVHQDPWTVEGHSAERSPNKGLSRGKGRSWQTDLLLDSPPARMPSSIIHERLRVEDMRMRVRDMLSQVRMEEEGEVEKEDIVG
jgi:hypothetical protein